MSYQSQEDSVYEGMPIELFTFQSLGKTWRYCNQAEQLDIGVLSYAPVAIKRSAIKQDQERTKNDITVWVDDRIPLVKDYVQGLPPSSVTLTVHRIHRNPLDGTLSGQIVTWTGTIIDINRENGEAQIRCQNTRSALNKVGLRRKYGANCAHFLYRAACGVSKADFRDEGSALAISGQSIQIGGTPTRGAGWYVNGLAEWSGQVRMIIGSDDAAQPTLQLIAPFDGITVGQPVSISAGCDRTHKTCKDKFNNVDRFGGFPYIPVKNVFSEGI
jgi:uncharacterized phage protein (TIGR02218 family)